MRVWDGEALSPEWLAHSRLAKDLAIGDVMIMGCGLAKIYSLDTRGEFVFMKLKFTKYFVEVDNPGDECELASNKEGRWMIVPDGRGAE